MGFGINAKKKKKVEEPTVDLEVEVPEIKPKEEPKVEIKEEPKVEEKVEETKEVKPIMQVISGQLLQDGTIQYVIIANKSIGYEVGEIVPLDDE